MSDLERADPAPGAAPTIDVFDPTDPRPVLELLKSGQLQAGIALAEERLAMARARPGPSPAAVVPLLKTLAQACHLAGNRPRAADLLEEVVALTTRLFGPFAPDTVRERMALLIALADAGREQDARQEALRLVRDLAGSAPSRGPAAGSVLTDALAPVTGAMGRRALRLLEEAQARVEQADAASPGRPIALAPAGKPGGRARGGLGGPNERSEGPPSSGAAGVDDNVVEVSAVLSPPSQGDPPETTDPADDRSGLDRVAGSAAEPGRPFQLGPGAMVLVALMLCGGFVVAGRALQQARPRPARVPAVASTGPAVTDPGRAVPLEERLAATAPGREGWLDARIGLADRYRLAGRPDDAVAVLERTARDARAVGGARDRRLPLALDPLLDRPGDPLAPVARLDHVTRLARLVALTCGAGDPRRAATAKRLLQTLRRFLRSIRFGVPPIADTAGRGAKLVDQPWWRQLPAWVGASWEDLRREFVLLDELPGSATEQREALEKLIVDDLLAARPPDAAAERSRLEALTWLFDRAVAPERLGDLAQLAAVLTPVVTKLELASLDRSCWDARLLLDERLALALLLKPDTGAAVAALQELVFRRRRCLELTRDPVHARALSRVDEALARSRLILDATRALAALREPSPDR